VAIARKANMPKEVAGGGGVDAALDVSGPIRRRRPASATATVSCLSGAGLRCGFTVPPGFRQAGSISGGASSFDQGAGRNSGGNISFFLAVAGCAE